MPRKMHRPASTLMPNGYVARSDWSNLGLRVASAHEAIGQVLKGLPFGVLLKFEQKSGLPSSLIVSVLGITPRTLARRRAAGKISSEESERLLRVSSVYEKALELFEGNADAARRWLTTPRRYFARETPLDYARTELGAREVKQLIERLEHGVFS